MENIQRKFQKNSRETFFLRNYLKDNIWGLWDSSYLDHIALLSNKDLKGKKKTKQKNSQTNKQKYKNKY